MNIIIRTDASILIGTGHVMRSMTLAKQFERHGARVTFVCRKSEGNSISYLQSQGMKVITLPSIEQKSYDVQWELDAEGTIEIISKMNSEIDLIIVDHYGLDNRWEGMLRRFTRFIMVIDDLADRLHDCDLLLDQNYYVNMNERYSNLIPNHCIQMLGPDYVLLRDEFLKAANEPRNRTGKVSNILVFFGGTDPTNETIKTLKAISELNTLGIEINVIVGETNPKRYEIEQLCKEMSNTNFYCQVNNMAEMMRKADLAIGAGGATTWERCFLELPSLTIITASNQIEVTNTVEKMGGTICLGISKEVKKEGIQGSLSSLIKSPQKLIEMSIKCREIVNPLRGGTFSIVDKIRKVLVVS